MRPLSFTRNLGGFEKAYKAIRKGFAPGITVRQFRERCGLGQNVSLVVTEFLLGTHVQNGEEIILTDSLITHTLSQPYSRLTARLYFFALNLSMPGERIEEEHLNPAEMQNTLMREHLFTDRCFRTASFEKDQVEDIIREFNIFKTNRTLRKWVNNYTYMAGQCGFVPAPDGHLETFPDNWGPLALRLFFERCAAVIPAPDVDTLVSAGQARELYKLIGVPKRWMDSRIAGAAEIFLSDQNELLLGFEESEGERRAAKRGIAIPPTGGETQRRERLTQQIIRRAQNRTFLQTVYEGECQLSGVKLRMPGGAFSIDCAHIRPLGVPHDGEDDVSNMLSLSPTMHRLFDRGCVRIDPDTLSITLLHGNDLPHREKLLIRGTHVIHPGNLSYHLSNILK
jgi:hypothetical protein